MTLRDLGVRRAVTGAAWMRASLGAALLYEYAANYSWRYYFWGPDRISQAFPLSGLSPYAWSDSLLYFDVILLVGILVTVLFTVGIGGRPVTVCVYVMTTALQDLNGLITDGGDNITRIVLLYMIFADLSGRRDREVSTVTGLVHNAAILAIVVQLSLLYLSTGLYKMMGPYWQNGVALYYILRVNSFSWTGIGGAALYENEYLVVALTYATVLFEVAFSFALLNSWARRIVLIIGLGFHFGIAVTMGLVVFSWMMLSLYFVCLTDREYDSLKWAFSSTATGTVLYDGVCGFCGRFVDFVRRRDEHGALHFEHLQGDYGKRILEARGADPQVLDTLYVLDERGQLLARSAAVVFVLRRLGWPWPWLGVIASALPLRLRDAAYDRMARNRYVFGGVCVRQDPPITRERGE